MAISRRRLPLVIGNDTVKTDGSEQQREDGRDDDQDHDERPLLAGARDHGLQRVDVRDRERQIQFSRDVVHDARNPDGVPVTPCQLRRAGEV